MTALFDAPTNTPPQRLLAQPTWNTLTRPAPRTDARGRRAEAKGQRSMAGELAGQLRLEAEGGRP